MKYETSLFTAEFDEENGGSIWITDKATGKSATLEEAYAGYLGTSQKIAGELEKIDDFFWKNLDFWV